MESVEFKLSDKKDDKGWPEFKVTNLGDKTVKFMSIFGYAYDKAGKQLMKTPGNLSWNGELKPGQTDNYDVSLTWSDKAPPPEATQFEACYDNIKFDGSDKFEEDRANCPAQRPLGGVKKK